MQHKTWNKVQYFVYTYIIQIDITSMNNFSKFTNHFVNKYLQPTHYAPYFGRFWNNKMLSRIVVRTTLTQEKGQSVWDFILGIMNSLGYRMASSSPKRQIEKHLKNISFSRNLFTYWNLTLHNLKEYDRSYQ